MKTYPTKTQATKAKKFGQTVRKRRDGTWVCEKPKVKVGKGRTTLNIQAVDIESAFPALKYLNLSRQVSSI